MCAGVVPHLKDHGLEEEDGVAMEDRRRPWADRRSELNRALRIGVIAVPHMANFTDFDALAAEPSVSLAYLEDPADAGLADVMILPGSKQTLDDLQWLRDRGFADFLESFAGIVIGICGGFQLLGLSIDDPDGVESDGMPRTRPGLCKLQVRTIMRGEKTVRRRTGRSYEIHMGETTPMHGDIVSDGKVTGTYIHGLFDDDTFRHSFLAGEARESCVTWTGRKYAFVAADREARIDRWAVHLRRSLDMKLIRGWVGA